jgi:hypothetical protein
MQKPGGMELQMATPAQTIACVNEAWYVMSFTLEVFFLQDANAPHAPQGIFEVEGLYTDQYPASETRQIDLSHYANIPEGALVRPKVYPVWGVPTRCCW